jgi:hypothetical protein
VVGQPSVNNAVAERAGSETIPLVASTSDGGAYVAWFDPTDGSYAVRLQRLNAIGAEQWPHNGILISDHPQNSALFGWDMIADSQDEAVIVFSDQRAGGRSRHLRVSDLADGQFLWGPDGVTLSNNPTSSPRPRSSRPRTATSCSSGSATRPAATGTSTCSGSRRRASRGWRRAASRCELAQ